jgi:pheromone shutdown protein TraB
MSNTAEFRKTIELEVQNRKFTNRIDRFFVKKTGEKYVIAYVGAGSKRVFTRVTENKKYPKIIELYRKLEKYTGHELLDGVFLLLTNFIVKAE